MRTHRDKLLFPMLGEKQMRSTEIRCVGVTFLKWALWLPPKCVLALFSTDSSMKTEELYKKYLKRFESKL